MAGIYREAWSGQVLKLLTQQDKDTFLKGLPDFSQFVTTVGEAQVIHLTDMGVLPTVLINNTTYPLTGQTFTDTDIPITLDKLQTLPSYISDDELYAITYDKMARVAMLHMKALQIKKTAKAAHSFAPSGNTASMPVLVTTGPDDGTGRKRLLWDDIQRLKTSLDNLDLPDEGRRLVLCKDHENDLCVYDQRFKDQYYNRADGTVFNQLGFNIFSYVANPYYTPATKTKLSFGATPGATDRRATVFFLEDRVATATGKVKAYARPAAEDPENQRNTINFRHYYIALPTKEEARGAIVSNNVS